MEEESNPSIHTKEVTRLWRSWRTIHEMVQDRVRATVAFHKQAVA
jgi:DNA-directed RNA polymerase I, II, and III subunit RPABC1